MAIVLMVLNLAACTVIWWVAMYFYLRHGRPLCMRHHMTQICLMFAAVGAMGVALEEVRGTPAQWWEVVFRVGVAGILGHWLWRWRRSRRLPG